MVPKLVKYPFRRGSKVAFMYLTRGQLPFLPLWERFFGGHGGLFSIYVHTPPGIILDVSPDSVFFGRQVPSQDVSWGAISVADAEKRLLANAPLVFSNERFVLLSESCMPIYKFKIVYKYLTQSTESFAESFDDPTCYVRGRYSRPMAPDIMIHHWRKGSQWFEMQLESAVDIISTFKYYALFRKYCIPSCYTNEHYTYSTLPSTTVPSLGTAFGRENITESSIRDIRNNGTDCFYSLQRTLRCPQSLGLL